MDGRLWKIRSVHTQLSYTPDGLFWLNQDETCHATSNYFHGSSVQTKDVMGEEDIVLGNESVKQTKHSSYMILMPWKKETDL